MGGLNAPSDSRKGEPSQQSAETFILLTCSEGTRGGDSMGILREYASGWAGYGPDYSVPGKAGAGNRGKERGVRRGTGADWSRGRPGNL